MKRTSSLHRQKRLVSVGRIRKRNAKRRKSEFARCYGSKERVEWVKQRPCVVLDCWNIVGTCENAHIENGGTGRKADADKIVPACPTHHREMHNGIKTFAATHGLDLEWEAARIENLWQAYLNTQEKSE